MGHVQTTITKLITWAQVDYPSSRTPPPPFPTTTTLHPYKPVKCFTYTKLSYSLEHPHHNPTVSRAHFFYWLRSKIRVTFFFNFSADILIDHGLTSVFLEWETHIRRVYLHARFVWMILMTEIVDLLSLKTLATSGRRFVLLDKLGTLSIDDEMGRRRRPEVKFSRANLLGMR